MDCQATQPIFTLYQPVGLQNKVGDDMSKQEYIQH
jgi:hypothetical protein